MMTTIYHYCMLIVCVLASTCGLSQSPQFRQLTQPNSVLGNATIFPTDAVADDFGPRYLGDHFHAGIDFNSSQGADEAQRWWMCLSPNAGSFPDIDRLTYGTNVYKYGLVNVQDGQGNGLYTWLLGHVFDDNNQFYDVFNHSIVLSRCEPPDNTKWGLHLEMLDASNNTIILNYAQVAGATLEANNTSWVTTNQVNTTNPFVPMGDSGGNVPVHLHLNTMPYNTGTAGDQNNGDPCEFLTIDPPQYTVAVNTETNPTGISLRYPGHQATKFKVRTQMQGEPDNVNRYDHLMDVDKVEVQIKKVNDSQYSRIQGNQTESVVDEGGRLGNPVVNHANPIDKTDWLSNGVNANAYNGFSSPPNNDPHPWDDYYFIDFPTRIHAGDLMGSGSKYASCPSDARYPDGEYDFRVELTRANNGYSHHAQDQFTIDNFRPYIEAVSVRTGTYLLYSEEWECASTCVQFSSNDLEQSIPGNLLKLVGFDIRIKSSEPLEECFISIDAFNISNAEMQQDPAFPPGMGFRYSVSGNLIHDEIEIVAFSFSGEDLNGNSLIAFTPSHDGTCHTVPTRDANNIWFNPGNLPFGSDVIHRFCLGCAMGGGLTEHQDDASRAILGSCETQVNIISEEIELTFDKTNPTYNLDCRNGAVDLHIDGGVGPYDVVWSYVYYHPPYPPYERVIQSAEGISGNNDGEDIEGLADLRGRNSYYCVEVTDAFCGRVKQCFILECECSDDCTMDAEVVKAVCGDNGAIYAFMTCTEGTHDPVTIRWNDLPFGPHSWNRTGLAAGTYCLTATDVDGCKYEKCWDVIEQNSPPKVQLVEIENSSLCRDAGSLCNGSITISVSQGASVDWQNIPNPSEIHSLTVTDLCPGEYTVEVYFLGCVVTATYTIGCCYTWGSNPNYVPPISVDGEASSEDRSIILHVTGGGDHIYFEWTGPNGFTSSHMNLFNLAPGTYCVRVFDGCSEDEMCFTIVDCDLNRVTLDPTVINTCFGVGAGSISLNISNGNPPYTITWSNGQTGPTINNLYEGQYCANIVDAAGCELLNQCFTISAMQGAVSTNTNPCSRTVLCNGQSFTDYYEYVPTVDCNTLYLYCPVTNQTIIITEDYLDIFTFDCDVYGICFFSGEYDLLEYGQTIQNIPPAAVQTNSCGNASAYLCYDSYCYIGGQYYINEEDPPYCADEFDYWNDPINSQYCGSGCLVDVYCGNSYVGSYCDPYYYRCYGALQDSGAIETRTYHTLDPNIVLFRREMPGEDSGTLRIDQPNDSFFHVYPNPSTGNIWLEGAGVTQLKIVNMAGVVMKSIRFDFDIQSPVELDLSSLGKGVYFVRGVNEKGETLVKRIVLL